MKCKGGGAKWLLTVNKVLRNELDLEPPSFACILCNHIHLSLNDFFIQPTCLSEQMKIFEKSNSMVHFHKQCLLFS